MRGASVETTSLLEQRAAVLGTMTCLCTEVIAAVRGYMAMGRACLWLDGWHPSQWAGCRGGLNEVILEVFVVTDTR